MSAADDKERKILDDLLAGFDGTSVSDNETCQLLLDTTRFVREYVTNPRRPTPLRETARQALVELERISVDRRVQQSVYVIPKTESLFPLCRTRSKLLK
jgi:hypothetical protein